MTSKKFSFFYLIAFLFTYVIRYMSLLSGQTVGYSVGTGGNFLGTAEIIMIFVYGVMIYISSRRGKETERGYLFIFPLIAGIIDIFFPLIVFVPTVFNVVGMIFGIPDGKNAQATNTKA